MLDVINPASNSERPTLPLEPVEMRFDGFQKDSHRLSLDTGPHTPNQNEIPASVPTLRINSAPVMLSPSQLHELN